MNSLKLTNRAQTAAKNCSYFISHSSLLFQASKAPDTIAISSTSSTASISSTSDQIAFYLSQESNVIVVGLKDGEIVVVPVDLDLGTLNEPDHVGIIEDGIMAMEQSPDGELLVVVSGSSSAKSVILMTRDFEIVSEIPITTTIKNEFVSVGWGKKETQFHGSIGKSAAVTPAKTLETLESVDDDGKPRISWRGDGDYFVVSLLSQGQRTLQIYSREAILMNTSEPIPGLEHTLAWRPSGNLIASTQKQPHRHDLVFFEKNGLRHGEFSLPSGCVVHDLAWNTDSSTLALLLTISGKRFIQLYSSNNYHWYLRHQISGNHLKISWDTEKSFLLHTLTDTAIHSYDFCYEIYKSNSVHESYLGTVAVIDGASVLYTPFAKHNVPPPMSHSKSEHRDVVLNVCFSPDIAGDSVACLLANNTIEFVNGVSGLSKNQVNEGLLDLLDITNDAHQICWIASNKLLVVGRYLDHDQLLSIEFDLEKNIVSTSGVDIPENDNISHLHYNVNLNLIGFQSKSGNVYELESQGDAWICNLKVTLPECSKLSTCLIGGKNEPQRVWLGLSSKNKLFLDGDVLITNCTSFELHNEF